MKTSRVVFEFHNHKVLVTGATSGIGRAVAEAFASAGADLILTGRDQSRGEQVVSGIEALGRRAQFIAGDLTDPGFCESLVAQAYTAYGSIDVAVNSAGIIYHADAVQTTDQQWFDTMAINVNACFFVCRAVLSRMRETGGVIVNIASDAGLSASRALTAYNASKGAVIQMSRSMARDFGADNVRVIPVCPGDVDTPMLRGEFQQKGISAEAGLADSAAGVPLDRVCTSEEVAQLVLYAASDAAAFMSGYPLVLDAANRA